MTRLRTWLRRHHCAICGWFLFRSAHEGLCWLCHSRLTIYLADRDYTLTKPLT